MYDAAQRVLQTSRSLRSTHSNRSIRELMKKQAGKGALDSIAEEQEADAGRTTKPPQIQKCARTLPQTSQPLSRTKCPRAAGTTRTT